MRFAPSNGLLTIECEASAHYWVKPEELLDINWLILASIISAARIQILDCAEQ